MPRPNLFAASVVLTIASVILLLALLVTQGAAAHVPAARVPTSPPAAPPTFQPPSRYCYSWDFNNSTGQDATGVQLRLSDVQTPTEVYTDTLNPFGDPDPSSGYDAGTGTYRFNFGNGVAYDSDRVLLGLCTDQAHLRLDPVGGAQWFSDTTPLAPAPLFAGVEFNWLARDQVTVKIVNEQDTTMTLDSAIGLQPDVLLPLTDLIPDIAQQLPLVTELITEPMILPPLASQAFDVQLTALNQPIVFEVQLSPEDDPTDMVHLLAQTTVPGWQVFLPIIRR